MIYGAATRNKEKLIPIGARLILILAAVLIACENLIEAGLSLSSTGTEFFVISSEPPILQTIFPNTTIFLYINEDEIIDYTIGIENISKTIISPSWKTRTGSRIKSDKPVIYKQLSYQKNYAGKSTIEKYYCPVPDISSYREQYLARPAQGVHTILSSTDIDINIRGKNTDQTIPVRRNIPYQFTPSEDVIVVSSGQDPKTFISFNAKCIDNTLNDEFYTSEDTIDIIPISGISDSSSGQQKEQIISIDYNNDGIIDQRINVSKAIRIRNIAPGAQLLSDRNFAVMQYLNISWMTTSSFSFTGYIAKSREKILAVLDENIKELNGKIIYPTNTTTDNTFNRKITGFDWMTDMIDNFGLEVTQKYQSNLYVIFSPEIPNPQISAVDFPDETKERTIIRIFNPQKDSTYENLTISFNCTDDCGLDINSIAIKNLITDKTTEDNNIAYAADTKKMHLGIFSENSYIEITGKNIISYILEADEEN